MQRRQPSTSGPQFLRLAWVCVAVSIRMGISVASGMVLTVSEENRMKMGFLSE